MGDAARLIAIEIVYALPRTQAVVTLKVPVGTTVKEAIALSGIAVRHPGVDWDAVAVGIYGKRTSIAAPLYDHDRIEIYRPLTADPKQVRRKRARRALKAKR